MCSSRELRVRGRCMLVISYSFTARSSSSYKHSPNNEKRPSIFLRRRMTSGVFCVRCLRRRDEMGARSFRRRSFIYWNVSVGRSAAADDVKTVTAVERISTSCLPSWEKPDNKRRHQCGLVEFPFPPRPRAGAAWLTLLLTAEKASEKSAYWSRGQPLFAPLLRHKSYFRTAKWLDTGDLL